MRLDNFAGPFEVLLALIAKHELDITEVALSQVTDEFLEHTRAVGQHGDLEQTSAFVVVAATLLDLKAARLLPGAEVEDTEDLAALEAGDLLFARLLQYRAYRQVADHLAERMAAESSRLPRTTSIGEQLAGRRRPLRIGVGPRELAALAAQALAPRPQAQPPVGHLHAPAVSVREEALAVVALLRSTGAATFRELTGQAAPAVTVARFLALLELYRDGAVAFEQERPLSQLTVRWTGRAVEEVGATMGQEYDAGEGGDR